MPPKDQLSEEINEVLDSDLDFAQMKKEDLEILHEAVHEGHMIEPLVKQVAKDRGKDKLDEVIDEHYVGKYALKILG